MCFLFQFALLCTTYYIFHMYLYTYIHTYIKHINSLYKQSFLFYYYYLTFINSFIRSFITSSSSTAKGARVSSSASSSESLAEVYWNKNKTQKLFNSIMREINKNKIKTNKMIQLKWNIVTWNNNLFAYKKLFKQTLNDKREKFRLLSSHV